MQLLMRRPEIVGFMCAGLPANMYDFSFLAPCPASGLIVHGERDAVSPPESVVKLVNKLCQQRGITIDFLPRQLRPFFTDHMTSSRRSARPISTSA